jgi:hypothetical protein
MFSLRAAILAGLLTLALPSAAQANRTVVVTAPASTLVTMAVSEPVEGKGPPRMTLYVTPRADHRALRRERALFQTWTGFRKQYSGDRYPF